MGNPITSKYKMLFNISHRHGKQTGPWPWSRTVTMRRRRRRRRRRSFMTVSFMTFLASTCTVLVLLNFQDYKLWKRVTGFLRKGIKKTWNAKEHTMYVYGIHTYTYIHMYMCIHTYIRFPNFGWTCLQQSAVHVYMRIMKSGSRSAQRDESCLLSLSL